MDEELKGNQRGNIPESGANHEGKGSRFFQTNGLDHFSFNSKTVVTYGLLSSLVGVCLGTLSFYNRFGTAVDERIESNRPLNEKLYKIGELDKNLTDHETRLRDIEKYINRRSK